MKIDNNILAISKCMFQNRKDWQYVTDEQKSEFFFIFNRYFSKKYPDLAQRMNDKYQDKILGMNMWFHFMEGKPYPNWFWSKSEKKKETGPLTEKETNLLIRKFNIKFEELEMIIRFHPDEVMEELKYIRDQQKTANK